MCIRDSNTTVEGIGFAIPIDDVLAMVKDIMTDGYVTNKPYIGITPQNMTAQMAQQYRYDVTQGVFVCSVEPGSAAEKAGLQMGDVITKIGDTAISDMNDLNAAKKSYRAGDTVTLTIYRAGGTKEVELTFDAAPQTQETAQDSSQQQQQGGGSSGGGSTVGTGNLVWPSYCTYITSRQGPRTHPITGEYKNHGGTDIAASYGSAIYAADSGTIVRSADGWNGGWGNYVMIDHGNGMQTLYAHMSSRAVSVGQTVSRGQTIGYVGSTGMSSGPHLHFEMYINGSRIDPQTRYPGVSFTYSANA